MNALQSSASANGLPQINYSKAQYADEFSGERATLLQLAFANCKVVTVEEQLSGYSGAQTWRVATDTREVFVIKIAHASTIEREYENYITHRVHRLRNAARQEDKPFSTENGEWALLKSTFARIYQTQTLLEYLSKNKEQTLNVSSPTSSAVRMTGGGNRSKETDQLGRLLRPPLPEHLRLEAFDGSDPGAEVLKAGAVAQDRIAELEKRVIEEHHKPNLYLENFHVEKVRNGVLTICADPPPNVESPKIRIKVDNAPRTTPGATISIFAKNLQTRRELLNGYARQVVPTFIADSEEFDSEYMKYPNPIPYLQELLELTDETKFSTIHGDLNLQNILIELGTDNNKRYRDNWLIDFAETGKGPVLLDLQWLEVQVITWILAPAIQGARENINKLQDVFDALADLTDWPSHLSPALRTHYKVLLEIRRLVEKEYLTIKGDWSEYYQGLVIALLGSLRFEQLTEFSRKVAFLSAATVIRHTEVLPSHLKDLPKPIIIGPRSVESPIIDRNSVPSKISPDQMVLLRGGSYPSAALQVKANQIVIANVVTNENGRWQTELSFDRVGNYQITVHDNETDLQSTPLELEVIKAPTISETSIPQQVLPGKLFYLRGTARPHATVQILANDHHLAETTCNQAGRWQTEIQLDKAGAYELRVQDDETGIESAAALLTVLAPPTITESTLPKRILPNINFIVEGQAAPDAAIKLLANQQALTTVRANHAGRWRAEVALPKAGTYQVVARDEGADLETAAVAMTVAKPAVKFPWRALAAAPLVLLILYMSLSFGGILPMYEPLGSVVTQSRAFVANLRSTSTPTPTLTPPPIPTPTPLPTAAPTTSPAIIQTMQEAEAYLNEQGKLVVAASVESGPYVYKDPVDGRMKGFEAELVRALARRWFSLPAGVDPEAAGVLVFMDTKVAERAWMAIQPGIDFLIGSVTYTPARCEPGQSDGRICTNGYSSDPQALVVAADSPISGYCDPALDNQNTVFIVLEGTTGQETLEGYKGKCNFTQAIKLHEVQSREDAFNEILLDDGRIKVYKSNLSLLAFAARRHENHQAFKVISGRGISDNESYGMWLNANHKGLRDLIDQTLSELRQAGSFATLCEEFTGAIIGNDCVFEFAQPPLAPEPTSPASPAPPIKIGIAIDLTGINSTLGADQKNGATLAEAYFNSQGGINGAPLSLLLADNESDQSDEQPKSVKAFGTLIDNGVVAIIGPSLSQQAFVVDAYYQDPCIPIIGPSNTAAGIPQLGPCILRVSAPVADYVKYVVAYAYKQGVSQVVVAYAEDDAFSRSETASFQQAIADHGLPIAEVLTFTTQVQDFSTQVEQVQRAGADLVVISGLQKDGATLIAQLRETGYTGLIIGGNGLNTPRIFPFCKQWCDGVLIAQAYNYGVDTPINQAFVEAYQAKYGSNPPQFTAQLFTAVQVVVEALSTVDQETPIREIPLADLRVLLAEKLLSGMAFQTVLGEISFDPEGEIQQTDFYIARIDMREDGESGEFQMIEE
ncbi:MAG: ABC transporter substrate-binding protein [Caldilineaceae bacterium]